MKYENGIREKLGYLESKGLEIGHKTIWKPGRETLASVSFRKPNGYFTEKSGTAKEVDLWLYGVCSGLDLLGI